MDFAEAACMRFVTVFTGLVCRRRGFLMQRTLIDHKVLHHKNNHPMFQNTSDHTHHRPRDDCHPIDRAVISVGSCVRGSSALVPMTKTMRVAAQTCADSSVVITAALVHACAYACVYADCCDCCCACDDACDMCIWDACVAPTQKRMERKRVLGGLLFAHSVGSRCSNTCLNSLACVCLQKHSNCLRQSSKHQSSHNETIFLPRTIMSTCFDVSVALWTTLRVCHSDTDTPASRRSVWTRRSSFF